MSPTLPQGQRVPARWRGRPALPGRRHWGPAPDGAEHCLRVLVDDLRNEEDEHGGHVSHPDGCRREC